MPRKIREEKLQYQRDYYLKNRDRALVAAANAREADKVNGRVKQKKWDRGARGRRQALIRDLKDEPCVDCGHEYPHYVMDFDHVRGEKLFSIGRAYHRSISVDEIIREAAKCDVVCSNCHRERTHGPKNASS